MELCGVLCAGGPRALAEVFVYCLLAMLRLYKPGSRDERR